MNRTVLCGVAAFALLIGAGLALTESSAEAGHGCAGYSSHHRGGGCGGGGLFSRHHRSRGCAGAHHARSPRCAGAHHGRSSCAGARHGRSGCGGGLLARLHARHNRCAAPAPTCCAPAPAPVECCQPVQADCCPTTSVGQVQAGCDVCAGGEVIVDSGAAQGGQVEGGAVAPPAPPQEDGGQDAAPEAPEAPDAPPAPQPEAEAEADQTEA